MQIHNLQNISIAQIAEAFNKAFETYFVAINFNEQQLREKIKSDNISLEYSVGITIDNQLAGFILIGIDTKNNEAYNAGTGTIPKFRGQKLTEKMYAYLMPQLDKIGIQNHMLEVICQNKKALRIYRNLGYSITRKVICYKGKVSETKNSNFKISTIDLPNETEITSFCNHKPTYQNSLFCLNNNPEKHTVFGAFDNERLIGYIVFDKDTLRVKQFGVTPNFRNKGVGHQLFDKVQKQNPETEILLINIAENDLETNRFLQNIGFKKVIEQYEMEMKLN
jgi:ribosomal protein S18 acetylase RimI-like enzyme